MFKKEQEEAPEEEEEQIKINIKINPLNLLKPTDIPQHVLDEKKNNISNNKTEETGSETDPAKKAAAPGPMEISIKVEEPSKATNEQNTEKATQQSTSKAGTPTMQRKAGAT